MTTANDLAKLRDDLVPVGFRLRHGHYFVRLWHRLPDRVKPWFARSLPLLSL